MLVNLFEDENTLTDTKLIRLKKEADEAAFNASKTFFENTLNGEDTNPRGHAWVEIIDYRGMRLTGNNELGRILKRNGIPHNEQNHFGVWKPGQFKCHNMLALKAGAEAFANIFMEYGFYAIACCGHNY